MEKEYDFDDIERLAESVLLCIWIKDENGRYRYVNNRFTDFFGIDKEDIIGKDVRALNIK